MATKKQDEKPAKKAAGKTASKAAHKVAKKAAKKTARPGNDVRRAYEHLARLRSLGNSMTPAALEQARTLSRYAQAAFQAKHEGAAADLLRAAEHLAFGSLATKDGAVELSKELRTALKEEFRERLERAGRHWDDQKEKPAKELRSLYKELRSAAKDAWKEENHSGALEYARAADALAHAAPARLRLDGGSDEEHALLPTL